MKTAKYTNLDGEDVEVSYDENAPCIVCGLPVTEASMSGTVICPWCDCGKNRDGTPWTYKDAIRAGNRIMAVKLCESP